MGVFSLSSGLLAFSFWELPTRASSLPGGMGSDTKSQYSKFSCHGISTGCDVYFCCEFRVRLVLNRDWRWCSWCEKGAWDRCRQQLCGTSTRNGPPRFRRTQGVACTGLGSRPLYATLSPNLAHRPHTRPVRVSRGHGNARHGSVTPTRPADISCCP